jgi:hypothetical protein
MKRDLGNSYQLAAFLNVDGMGGKPIREEFNGVAYSQSYRSTDDGTVSVVAWMELGHVFIANYRNGMWGGAGRANNRDQFTTYFPELRPTPWVEAAEEIRVGPTEEVGVYEDGDDMAKFEGGGVRSSDAGKPRFDLLFVSDLSYEEQILTRAAVGMAEGAVLYGDKNHEKMNTQDALDRCKGSLVRHVMQYVNGETDEDHLSRIVTNCVMLSGIEKRVKDDGEA